MTCAPWACKIISTGSKVPLCFNAGDPQAFALLRLEALFTHSHYIPAAARKRLWDIKHAWTFLGLPRCSQAELQLGLMLPMHVLATLAEPLPSCSAPAAASSLHPDAGPAVPCPAAETFLLVCDATSMCALMRHWYLASPDSSFQLV